MGRFMVLVLALLVPAGSSLCRTWDITPDGHGDAASIKAGIDSAQAGDTVLVACGTYYEADIRMKTGVALVSGSASPDCVTIDAECVNRVFLCDQLDSTTIIRGFTITNGVPAMSAPPGSGGGMLSDRSPALEVVDCVFRNNRAGFGGGVCCESSSPAFINCVFEGNDASYGGGMHCTSGASPMLENCAFLGNTAGSGGGISCWVACSPEIINCTLYANDAQWEGGGIYCTDLSTPLIENTIVAYSTSGGAIVCEDDMSNATLSCCNVFGNTGGDWVGLIADQLGANGNFSACPSFCDPENGDVQLCDESPCLPGNHPDGCDCALIGARNLGCSCGPSGHQTATWGAIKAGYK